MHAQNSAKSDIYRTTVCIKENIHMKERMMKNCITP